VSHHAIEDLAILRSLPRLQVLAPGDPHEAAAAVRAALAYDGPTFIRLGQNNDPVVHAGPVDTLRRLLRVRGTSREVAVFATGHILSVARDACDRTASSTGIDVSLYSVPSIKPLDAEGIAEVARGARLIATVEEHSAIGGLGTALVEVLFAQRWSGHFERFALPDAYCDTHGTLPWLRARYGLDAASIAKRLEGLSR
jgi:transketolase